GLQHVDQILAEVLANLHDREVRAERRGFRAQRGRRGVELGQNLVCRARVEEIGTRDQGRKTETGVVEGHALDVQGRPSGLVEHQLQRVAVQQVDAVEGRVLRGRVD